LWLKFNQIYSKNLKKRRNFYFVKYVIGTLFQKISLMRISNIFFKIVFIAGVCAPFIGNAQVLQGSVIDIKTKEGLIGASVFIESISKGVNTDESGNFTFRDIPQGTYTVKASYSGYKTQVQYQVLVQKGVTPINFELEEASVELEGVEILASPFTKTAENPVSIKSIGLDQIRSNPGGNFDISKVVQSLPGVSGSVGFRNDIIVRGGAPNENVFYVDGIEVPFINHFATQGAGGGPVGILNALFIEKLDFQSSAFGAQYDNALSSVLDFKMISGNKEKMQRQFQLGASEAGITLDGPIGKNKKTTYLFSARRSYLQFLFQAIGLPFLPDYWDFQTKVEHKFNDRTSLSFIGIGSIDNFKFNLPDNPTLEDSATLAGIPDVKQWSYTNGLVFKRITEHGFYTIALSRNMLENGNEKYDFDLTNDPTKLRLKFTSQEIENKLRLNWVQNRGKWRIGYGAVLQYVKYNNKSFIRDFVFRTPAGIFLDTLSVNTGIDFFKGGVYGSLSRAWFNNRLTTSIGIRSDINSFTDTGMDPIKTLSPRGSISYALTEKWTISASVGRYFKLPPYTILGFNQGQINQPLFVNQNTEYTRTDHYVAGISYAPSNSAIISIEGFYKDYAQYPVSAVNQISLANLGGDFGVLGNERVISIGKGSSYGVEAFVQKKLTERIFGIASYTIYWASFSGIDVNRKIRSAWDNRHLVSITAGYRFKRNWELSGKVRYLAGFPFTPYDISRSLAEYPLTGNGVFDYAQLNTLESEAFLQVDTRLDKKWFFPKWTLNLYLDIQNLLQGSNITTGPSFAIRRNPDGTPYTDAQNPFGVPVLIPQTGSTLIPSFGAIVRF